MNKHPIHIHTHIDVYDRQSSVTQFFINHTSLVARRTPTHTHIAEFIIQCQTKQNKKCRIFLVLHNCDRFQFQFFFRFWFFSNDTIIPFLLFHGNWFFLFSFFFDLIWFKILYCICSHENTHTHTHCHFQFFFWVQFPSSFHHYFLVQILSITLHILIIYIDYYYYNKYSVH